MRAALVFAVCLTAGNAQAKDVALVLDDNDQQVMRQVLDRATRVLGLEIAPATVHLLNKLNAAPVVTQRNDEPSSDKPKDAPP